MQSTKQLTGAMAQGLALYDDVVEHSGVHHGWAWVASGLWRLQGQNGWFLNGVTHHLLQKQHD